MSVVGLRLAFANDTTHLSNLSLLCSAQSAQLSQSGFCDDHLAPSDMVEVIWDCVGAKEITKPFQKAIIECQKCFSYQLPQLSSTK